MIEVILMWYSKHERKKWVEKEAQVKKGKGSDRGTNSSLIMSVGM